MTEFHDSVRRIQLLRQQFDRLGVDGLIVPRQDSYLTREVPPDAERLAWLSGFTGSAGTAVVMRDFAALFVDGRYVVQAGRQVPGDVYEIVHSVRHPVAKWLEERIRPGDRLGLTPRFHSIADVELLGQALARRNATLVALDESPIDALWTDRPGRADSRVVVHGMEFAGEDSREKAERVAKEIRAAGADALVVNALESAAWLFNIRGNDLANTPVARCNALVNADGSAQLFIDKQRLDAAVLSHLGNHVVVRSTDEFQSALEDLGRAGACVQLSPANTNAWILQTLEKSGGRASLAPDPCLLMRACKNEVEVNGARTAHLRDGVALTRFIHWLKRERNSGSLSEREAQERLLAFRAEGERFHGSSFPSISAAGPNAAVVHYSAADDTMLKLDEHPLYLIDSGAQYPEGTTDVTRTIAVGEPTDEMRRNFTLVLKGHISLARARFPLGTGGAHLDALARQHLWRHGLDYDHSTGHGVGSFLSVHEGPHLIAASNSFRLMPGMIVSNEPGYYKANAYGMRFENLMVVRECGAFAGSGAPMLEFEMLTLAPVERGLLDFDLLDRSDLEWIDWYHAKVMESLAPGLSDSERHWLRSETAPLLGGADRAA